MIQLCATHIGNWSLKHMHLPGKFQLNKKESLDLFGFWNTY